MKITAAFPCSGRSFEVKTKKSKKIKYFFKKLLTNQLFCGIIFQSSRKYLFKAEHLRRSRVAGRARTIGNRVTVKSGSRVRISPSP